MIVEFQAGAISSDSLSESDSRHGGSSNLLDALSLSSSARLDARLERVRRDTRNSLTPHALQVPYVVKSCFSHLQTYGRLPPFCVVVVTCTAFLSQSGLTQQIDLEIENAKGLRSENVCFW